MVGLNHSPRIVTDGLLLALDAGNTRSYPGSGTTWFDLSGNSNNGTLVNGPTYNSAGYFTFDGTNDSFEVTGFSCNKTFFSVEWWMYPTTNIDYNQNIIMNDGWGDFVFHTGSSSQYWVGTDVGTRFAGVDAGSVTLNTWQQWVFTFNSGAAKVYKNGIMRQSKTAMTIASRASYTSIRSTADSGGTNGRRSIVRLYSNKVLSDAEVLQNFNALRGRFGV